MKRRRPRKKPCEPCGGKFRYATWSFAMHVALVSTRRRGYPLRVYECPHKPGWWHLTSRAAPIRPTERTTP